MYSMNICISLKCQGGFSWGRDTCPPPPSLAVTPSMGINVCLFMDFLMCLSSFNGAQLGIECLFINKTTV